MSQGFEIIRARVKDDAVTLIDRIVRSKQGEIILVLPKNSIIAADLDSLKTLKSEAESIGKTLSLSTDNDKIKSFAKKSEILIYDPDDFKKAEKTKVIKTEKKIKIMTDVFPPSAFEEPENFSGETSDAPDKQPPEPEKQVIPGPTVYETANADLEKNIENFYSGDNDRKNGDLKNKKRFAPVSLTLNKIIIFFAAGGLLLFMATLYLILPKADIKLSLKTIQLKTQIPVAVSKNAASVNNLAASIIPGQYFSLSKSGSKTISAMPKIGGVIEIYNAYGAAGQKLVSGTRFETKDGKIFRIQNPIIIPGAKVTGSKLVPSSVKASVIGDKTSDDYLVGPSYFTIPGFKQSPKYAGFYALSAKSMTKTFSASLTKEDLEKNKNELKDQLARELKTETLNTLNNPDFRLINGAYSAEIGSFKINGNVLSMKIIWQAIFFKEKDLRILVNYFVQSRFPDLKNFSFEDNITYPEASSIDFKKGELFFILNLDKNNALSADISGLKKELAGRDENEIRAVISDKTYISGAAISLWPFWVKKAPNNPEKINITVDNQ